jgi:peptide/nickel transport system permease protein
LGGAVVTETIFSWPGVGRLTVESISRRDFPVVQASVMLLAATYVIVNFLIDILYRFIDPRIRLT